MSSNGNRQANSLQRILIVRLGAMGDVIHALPAAAALARALPQAKIDWIIEPHWACLLADNPHLNSVIPFPLKTWRKQRFSAASWSGFRGFIGELRASDYDLVIDLQGLIKSAVLARLSGAPRRAGFDRSDLREAFAANFYTEQHAATGQHVVDKNLAVVASLLGTTSAATEFPLPAGDVAPDLPASDFILATPVAGWGSKQWPQGHYTQLATLIHERFGIPVVLDCAPNDREYVEQIIRAAPEGSALLHVSTIPQMIGATRRARAVIGVDSGPLHIAAALGKQGVAIFGPTDPARNGPYGDTLTVLRDQTVCTTYHRNTEISAAMSSVTPEQVCEALAGQLP